MTATTMPAQIPNAEMGIMGENPVARNAINVVPVVIAIATPALRRVYDIRSTKSYGLEPTKRCSDWDHASLNTKQSSAAMPKMMKITKDCKLPK